MHTNRQILVIVPNWNGEDSLKACLDSLRAQTVQPRIVVVDNGSTDGSVALVEQQYPSVELIRHTKNQGYAGGVNPGFRRAQELNAVYVAPFNNDAVADREWLRFLSEYLEASPQTGIATCKLLSADGAHLDSTGEFYTSWGLPYPRGRGERDIGQYDQLRDIFGATGGASLYRVSMLSEIGILDEDFFAYYEDVDISFRAQLAGWKVAYVPEAFAYHHTGQTGGKIKGFYTQQTFKNLPLLLLKGMPRKLLPTVLPRFMLAYAAFGLSALGRGQAWYAIKGFMRTLILLPKKYLERRSIQKNRTVSIDYLRSILIWDLPPSAEKLRRLRTKLWRLAGKKS